MDALMEAEKLVPGVSVLVEGLLSKKIAENKISAKEIIIHESVLSLFERKANENRAAGFLGIDELEKLKGMQQKHAFELRFCGSRLSAAQKRFSDESSIDSEIRDLAFEEDAVLITADPVQQQLARSKGIKVRLETVTPANKTLMLEKYFDIETMSVHLRQGVKPYAKKGRPGSWKFTPVGSEILSSEIIQRMSREIVEEAEARKEGFIEIERPSSTIVQLGSYRIVITKPPFSDGWEITAVRPVKKLSIGDYELSDALLARISEQAEGMLIAGAPGMGKSTFAAALAEHYADQQKIVKTVEAPRDLVLPQKITQYAISHGDAQEIHDILLLSRPDYTIFDEMRNTGDFRLFADLRLAGIGFIGVVHATKPIDAIQRFVGRIELGVIPQVIDTVIFIKGGLVEKILGLRMLVKVPSGMTEADLARPVVVVSDFETKKPEFELYSYGEETVVIPVTENKKSPTHELAEKQLERELSKYSKDIEANIISDNKCIISVPEDIIPKIIGRQGKTISEIEKRFGISIDVQQLKNKQQNGKEEIPYDVKILGKSIVLSVKMKYADKEASVVLDGDYLLTAKISKKGIIKIKKNNKIGKILMNSINAGEDVRLAVQ